MWDLITCIESLSLGIIIFSLIVYVSCVRKVTVFIVVISSVVVLDIFQQWYRSELKKLFYLEDYLFEINTAWYLGFSITNTIFIVIVVWCLSRGNLLRDRVSEFVIIAYLFMTALQIIRYLDKTVFDTDLVGFIYRTSITTTNVVLSLVILVYVLRVLTKTVFKRRI
jgi:hypothetical protein